MSQLILDGNSQVCFHNNMIRAKIKHLSVYALKIVCWLLLLPLVLAPIPYFILLWRLQGTFTDGNALTDPITFILSYLTPAAAAGVVGLVIQRRYGLARRLEVVLGAVLWIFFTSAPLAYGIYLWHEWNVHWNLSYWAWWLEPIVILWSTAYAACLLTLRGVFVKKPCDFISSMVSTSIALLLGGVLAWNSLINDFTLCAVNLCAVTPFVIACLCLIRIVLRWTENVAA
ncbi:MAG TPA: hypothetical protein VNX46_04190 [Candidatus Acidoferrum sp.]|jgi:hypothetical protein|nr:hypothetical protein [Candidatus Acidoferrum sp.]